MQRRRAFYLTTVVAVLAAGTALTGASSRAATTPVTVSVTSYDFKVSYPSGGQTRQCNVVGDLYVPSTATPTHREPAILTTNGFGGSKADQAGIGTGLGPSGYITLSYSGLGFGGSGCPITDDDPSSDGAVASQLVSFLGGATGIAYTGFTAVGGWTGPVAALGLVTLDSCDHTVPTPRCGANDPNDPRVGMIGGSYGGQIQFAAAGDDPRIDTIVPIITWDDLSYSLDPGNSDLPGNQLAPGLPGVAKKEWDSFFFALGAAAYAGGGTSGSPQPQSAGEPQPISEETFGTTDAQCPGFQPETCVAEAQAATSGYADATAQQFFSHSSVTSYLGRINIPVFFAQGEHDSLFNLQEASATYTALRQRGVPVKMLWQSWGHSQIGAAPGEYPISSSTGGGVDAPLLQTYEGQLVGRWFAYYLQRKGPAPALNFSFFRDWAYRGPGADAAANEKAAAAAYDSAPSFPLTTVKQFDLSGTDALVAAGKPVTAGTAGLTSTPGGVGSYSNLDAAGVVTSYESPLPQPGPSDPPGTYAAWTTAPLTKTTAVVGIPTLDVTVSSGQAQTAGDPSTGLVLFAKLYDVAPDGTTITLPDRLISPVRVSGLGAAGSTTTLHISLPGISYRFVAGDSLRVVLASSDDAYAGNSTLRTATFSTSPGDPGVLTLPVDS